MKVYTIRRGGVDLTVQLSEEDAERLGATPVQAKPVQAKPAQAKGVVPNNKARKPNNK